MEKLTWTTEKRKVSELKAWPGNPRTISAEQQADLRNSIEKFGYVEIVAIDADNTILAGHMRQKTLLELDRGDEVIDVRVPSRKLTEDELQEYNLRSNKNTGSWDWGMLGSFGEDMLKNVGFADNELKLIFEAPKIPELAPINSDEIKNKLITLYMEQAAHDEFMEIVNLQDVGDNLSEKVIAILRDWKSDRSLN